MLTYHCYIWLIGPIQPLIRATFACRRASGNHPTKHCLKQDRPCSNLDRGWFFVLSGLCVGDAEPLHFGDECGALQAEPCGCALRASNDPIGFSQCLDDVFTLSIL